jgi:hypothetical protein
MTNQQIEVQNRFAIYDFKRERIVTIVVMPKPDATATGRHFYLDFIQPEFCRFFHTRPYRRMVEAIEAFISNEFMTESEEEFYQKLKEEFSGTCIIPAKFKTVIQGSTTTYHDPIFDFAGGIDTYEWYVYYERIVNQEDRDNENA